jgi:non-specific serine/threonine protein kinase
MTTTPFPATTRLHGAKPARMGRFGSRPWLVASTSLLAAVTVAWSLMPGMPTDRTSAVPELAAKPPPSRTIDAPVTVPAATTAQLLPPAALQVSAASTALPPVDTVVATTERAPYAKVKRSTPRKIAQERHVAAAPPAPSVGPAELCASRNFFLRPYCIQRRCEEPRFKAIPQCVQLRQMARRHDE